MQLTIENIDKVIDERYPLARERIIEAGQNTKSFFGKEKFPEECPPDMRHILRLAFFMFSEDGDD